MTLAELKTSLHEPRPPATLKPLVEALWHEARGDWEKAHNIAQDIETNDGSWIHAYLHRKEGDISNASYWYRRANQPVCKKSLSEEWDDIATALLR